MPIRQTRRDLLLLAIIGLVPRLLWSGRGVIIRGQSLDGPILSFDKTTDAGQYIVLARNLRFHHIFSLSQGVDVLTPTYFRAPGYPAMIAALWFSDPSKPPIVAICLLQALLGTFTAVAVFLIAREHFGRRVALIAGLGMALAPMSGVWTGEILTETLYTFLIAVAALLWGRKRYELAGICFGLSWLVRPTTMAFLTMVLLAMLLPHFRDRRRGTLVMVSVAVIVAGTWTVRNLTVFHQFVPVAIAGGRMALLFGTYDIPYHTDVWAYVKEHEPSIYTEFAWEDPRNEQVYYARALERIKADPFGWLIIRVKQFPRFLIDLGAYTYPKSPGLTSVIKIGFLIGNVVTFLLAAFALFWRHETLLSLPHITFFPIFLLLFHLPLWVESRYSLPMMPFVIILASISLDVLFTRIKRAGPQKLRPN